MMISGVVVVRRGLAQLTWAAPDWVDFRCPATIQIVRYDNTRHCPGELIATTMQKYARYQGGI